eukprot:347739-Pleurochrysis_carterae.AAC.1
MARGAGGCLKVRQRMAPGGERRERQRKAPGCERRTAHGAGLREGDSARRRVARGRRGQR